MDFLTGAFFVVGLRRSQGLVGTGGVESGGRKSHDRASHFTGSQGVWRPGTAGIVAMRDICIPLGSGLPVHLCCLAPTLCLALWLAWLCLEIAGIDWIRRS